MVTFYSSRRKTILPAYLGRSLLALWDLPAMESCHSGRRAPSHRGGSKHQRGMSQGEAKRQKAHLLSGLTCSQAQWRHFVAVSLSHEYISLLVLKIGNVTWHVLLKPQLISCVLV